ncbi:NAD-glutamate dehydrogenase [Sinomonas mesophila]|uniref:NAD-glutamate dehydrogenase n=1 Tax=Sinomonas mesophila TaxID=1531955 RepID=UPI000985BAAB|nr:NAD-glutamate dehydrogenase [Sinomonas mesophila]
MAKDAAPAGRPGTAGPAEDLRGTEDRFLADYYGHVAADDLLAYSSDTLARWADEHRSAARIRAPGHAVVEVRNEPESTIVAIAAEDVPYLLQSVTAELARQDAVIRLLLYPTFDVEREAGSHELLSLRPGAAREGLAAAYPGLQPAAAVAEPRGPEEPEEPERPGGTAGGAVVRGSAGHAHDGGVVTEQWIAAEIGRLASAESAARLRRRLRQVVADVLTVAKDSTAIQRDVTLAAEQVASRSSGGHEALEMLRWLAAGNFIFLGSRTLEVSGSADPATGGVPLVPRGRSGRGLLRQVHGEPTLRSVAPGARALSVYKSDIRSTVLRSSYLDEISVRVLDAAGAVTTERRFVGFFAQTSSDVSVLGVPVLREKVARVLAEVGAGPGTPAWGETLRGLEELPHDELFEMDTGELSRLAGQIQHLQERRHTRLFLRLDARNRFMSAVLFLPRQRYSTAVRLRVEAVLRRALGAEDIEFDVRVAEAAMVRAFFRILLPEGGPPAGFDAEAVERQVVAATRTWEEGIAEALRENYPTREAARLSRQWAAAFPASYRADYDAEDAIRDIARFESLGLDDGGDEADKTFLKVYVGSELAPWRGEIARIRVYVTTPRSLTQILPFFHNFGLEVLDQRPYALVRHSPTGAPGLGVRELYLYDLGLRYPPHVDPLATSGLLVDSLRAALRGDAESDRFDALVLLEGLDWRRVTILRAYAKYLQQLGTTISYGFMADALLQNPEATQALLELFEARFDPDLEGVGGDPHSVHDAVRQHRIAAARRRLSAAVDAVPSLDADRLLRMDAALVEATLRTNYYQGKGHLSLKLHPSALPFAPSPRPAYEIWVYSPRVEGVHLRYGPVARGGLRWSDRREDFRTEVLGLVRAQAVKNAVIVPTGAKGAFYPKRLPDPALDRAGWLEEGLEAYRTFIRGLLDVTDNLSQADLAQQEPAAQPRLAMPLARVVPPERVVKHDGDDSYLVVAADKGTAAFSDTANAIAAEYGFWLGDAFASGGSVGYDHKRMGITARGAWESVRSHFAELGVDVQREEVTVVGIGDMSGDVFGNGMLLSEHLRLVAAFDHRNIFLDPSPDPLVSHRERRRLFELPRSSWEDYSESLISAGGGVYSRRAKSVELSPQARAALGLPESAEALTPPELIQAILRAPVDLLYNGGIGTYVKATSETHLDVGDKANDAVRIDAPELRARVVAEGGNLGLTPLARIEASLNGVLVNSDAIDNSAGVDCSDHEVNIKVFTDRMIAAGHLRADERAPFLHSLTDEVSRLVLATNAQQNVLLLNDRALVKEWSQGFERTMDWLGATAGLDRRLEGLPDDDALHARLRDGHGLTSPELAILAAYAKIELADELAASDLADDPWFDRVLASYFPAALSRRFADELPTHPLRREIIATVMANEIINLGGITFAFRVREETTATAAAMARAFVVVRDAYGLGELADALATLPPGFPREHSAAAAVHLRRLLDRGVRWYVTHDHRDQPVERAYARVAPTLELLRAHTSDYLRGTDLERVNGRLAHWREVGLPDPMATRAADSLESFGLLDISTISEAVDEPIPTIADVYYAVFYWIGAASLLLRITDLPRESHWEALARAALRDDVYAAVTDMTTRVLQSTLPRGAVGGRGATAEERIAEWESGYAEQLGRIRETFAEVMREGSVDIESISVAIKLLRTLLRN